MPAIIKSDVFDRWLKRLRDRKAKAKIEARILRLSMGNPGDIKPIGRGISEMRIEYGPGYRMYFKQIGEELIILLCGGDKSTQQEDIAMAQKIAMDWKE
jgi:putative addiction module killer protein